MRRTFVVLLLVLVLVTALGGAASATSENAADRACQGAFASEVAKSQQPLGATVRGLASPSFGQLVSGIASTCDLPE